MFKLKSALILVTKLVVFSLFVLVNLLSSVCSKKFLSDFSKTSEIN